MTTNKLPEIIIIDVADGQNSERQIADTKSTLTVASVAGRLVIAASALFHAANLEAQTRPGTNQPKAPAVTQSQKPTTPVPAFKPTLGQPTAPKTAIQTPKQVLPTQKSVTRAKVDPSKATLGTAKAPARRVNSAAKLSDIKKVADDCYQTIAPELDEMFKTQPDDVRVIEAGFSRLIATKDVAEASNLYSKLILLMTSSPDFKTPSQLERGAVSSVAQEVGQMLRDSK